MHWLPQSPGEIEEPSAPNQVRGPTFCENAGPKAPQPLPPAGGAPTGASASQMLDNPVPCEHKDGGPAKQLAGFMPSRRSLGELATAAGCESHAMNSELNSSSPESSGSSSTMTLHNFEVLCPGGPPKTFAAAADDGDEPGGAIPSEPPPIRRPLLPL